MQKNIRDAIAPIARIIPMAIPALAPAVMSFELEVSVAWEVLLEVAADNAVALEDVAEADNNGRVLANDVEGERIGAGELWEALACVAAACGASVEELMPRSVVTVTGWASGVEVAAAG